jgi:molybdopterin/thiamine biosynthesis adenylyltransferase
LYKAKLSLVGQHKAMAKILKFSRYSLQINPSFWAKLYAKKLDEWRLDDSDKPCVAFVDGNTIHLDRVSLGDGSSDLSDSRHMHLSGVVRVFNTRNDLQSYYKQNKQSALHSKYQILMWVHADLKNYVFDYYFAMPVMYPSIPFRATVLEKCPDTDEVCFCHQSVTEVTHAYILPEIVRNVIYKEYQNGVRHFIFQNIAKSAVQTVLYLSCESSKTRYTGWSSAIMTTVNMSHVMQPEAMADHNAELNLKLMMWKYDPKLPLDILRQVNCVLVGSGTVGCAIARNLIAWGIKNVTFVDCANVTPSNPVRQSLYTIHDIGRDKSAAAARSLCSILPSVKSNAHTIDIPMPGHHHVGSVEDYEKLESLIKNSDVIFLSTDSREGRWTPTIIAQMWNKHLINVALGYDSMVVQRITRESGCYFCTDPIAPRDTTSSRTIDEKCTVSVPGISYIASSMAVDFYVKSLRQPLDYDEMRFNMTDTNFTFRKIWKNPLCPCCSLEMISELVDKGYRFIEEVKLEPSFLEELSGYSDIHHGKPEIELESMSSNNDDYTTDIEEMHL